MLFEKTNAKQVGLLIRSRLIDRRSILVVAALLLTVLGTVLAMRSTYAETSNASKTGKHVLTVHDSGSIQGILTDADTLREALVAAEIEIGEHDVTEPKLDETLVAASYDVNIYRARPVAVYDKGTLTKVMTPHHSAQQIAKQAGVKLQDEDDARLESSPDVVSDGAVERLVIDRSTEFTLIFYGKKTTEYTRASTVAELLTEKGINLTDPDRISPAISTKITAGITVDIWREGKQTVTREEAVDFPTRKIEDADQKVGYRKVTTPGVDGKRLATYEIVVKNGREVSKKLIKAVSIQKAVEEVVVVGTKPSLEPFTGGGSKEDWLIAAGISREHWAAADYIISQESGWNPNAVNPTSGACGLAQALPCTKVPGNPLDPVDSLTWMNGYVSGRYGGWEGAVAFKQANGWY